MSVCRATQKATLVLGVVATEIFLTVVYMFVLFMLRFRFCPVHVTMG